MAKAEMIMSSPYTPCGDPFSLTAPLLTSLSLSLFLAPFFLNRVLPLSERSTVVQPWPAASYEAIFKGKDKFTVVATLHLDFIAVVNPHSPTPLTHFPKTTIHF